MRGRFKRLWEKSSAQTDPTTVFSFIEGRYSEQGRWYHTLTHIQYCLEKLDLFSKGTPFFEVECALWFHDIIYDPQSANNEEQSAFCASTICKNAGFSLAFTASVQNLILITEHTKEPTSEAEKLIVDIDLAILGANRSLYDSYEENIRKEYSFVSDAEFNTGRTKILQHFLDRPRIYQTDYFNAVLERAARINLGRAINLLQYAS